MNTVTLSKVCYILPRLLKTSFKKDPVVFSLIINANFLCRKQETFNVLPKTQNIPFLANSSILFLFVRKKKHLP